MAYDPSTQKPTTPQEYAQWNAWWSKQQQGLTEGITGKQESNSFSPMPGESFADYQQRTIDTGIGNEADNPNAAKDAYLLHDLQGTEEAKSRAILGEQTGIQKTRLNDLAKLLTETQDAQFNRDLPGIANTSQGQGFLETSGFGTALANRFKDLSAMTSEKIAEQGLKDRDLEVSAIGDIGTNSNNLATGGLQRTYSTEDLTRSEELARELGRMGVSAPANVNTSADNFARYAQGAGSLLGGIGAVKGA